MFYEVHIRFLFGGVGRLLIDGIASLDRIGGFEVAADFLKNPYHGILKIARTGPFMPPITAPQSLSQRLVVSHEFRIQLEDAHLTSTDVTFQNVVKDHVVELHWERWDRHQDYPDDEPQSEPEEWYIRSRPHSPTAAEGLGKIWEALVPFGATVRFDTHGQFVIVNTWNGSHLFSGRNERDGKCTGTIVDDVGRAWLQERAADFVEFKELQEVLN